MPESHSLDAVVGPEVTPRPGFEQELATTLGTAWNSEQVYDAMATDRNHGVDRHRVSGIRVASWLAAAAVLVGALVFIGLRDDDELVGNPGDTAAPTTAPVVESAPIVVPASTIPAATLPGTVVESSPIVVPVSTTPAATLPDETVQSTSPESTPRPNLSERESVVFDYLGALEDGRWVDAAKVLGEGGLEWNGRADLRPLLDENGAITDLSGALQRWCEQALCRRPDKISTSERNDYSIATVHEVGAAMVNTRFISASFEGSPLVMGLPPMTSFGEEPADAPCPGVEADVTRWLQTDVDGDGRLEQVVLEQGDGASWAYRIAVCGTALQMMPIDVSESAGGLTQPTMSLFDLDGDGRGEALIGSPLSGREATVYGVYSLAGRTLLANLELGVPATGDVKSFGCADEGAGIVDITYRLVGGVSLDEAASVIVTRRTVLSAGELGEPVTTTLTLPADREAAIAVLDPKCRGLFVLAG